MNVTTLIATEGVAASYLVGGPKFIDDAERFDHRALCSSSVDACAVRADRLLTGESL